MSYLVPEYCKTLIQNQIQTKMTGSKIRPCPPLTGRRAYAHFASCGRRITFARAAAKVKSETVTDIVGAKSRFLQFGRFAECGRRIQCLSDIVTFTL